MFYSRFKIVILNIHMSLNPWNTPTLQITTKFMHYITFLELKHIQQVKGATGSLESWKEDIYFFFF